ncbi:MAG: hypothetical protein ACKOA2_02935 [Ilumatobacteraceae bacterium]
MSLSFLLVFGVGLIAPSAVPPTTDSPTGASGPLIIVPVGCAAPEPAVAVFEGTVRSIGTDAATVVVDRVLWGDLAGRGAGSGAVDVRYGDEVRFLEVGERYIVGVGATPTGRLRSTVRDAAPLFGGDAVIGLDDTDVDCPRLDDPVRTLTVDGSSVDTAVLAPLEGRSGDLLGALVRPLVIALLALIALVTVKHFIVRAGRVVRDSLDSPVNR